MHSSEPGFSPGDVRFKTLFGEDHGECADPSHLSCHAAQFTVGEQIPIKGAFWEVESCEGLTLILKYKGETKNSRRKLEAANKPKPKRKKKRRR